MKARTAQGLGEAVAKNDGDLYFCPLAFDHLYSDNAGRWRLCCRAKPFSHTVADTTPEEHWRHPLMQKIRREMLSGDLKEVSRHCQKCLGLEKDGIRSPRQQLNDKLLNRAAYADNTALRVASRMTRRRDRKYVLKERALELKLRVFGNYCNLRCYMCAPVNSSSRLQELRQIKDGYWMRYLKPPGRPDLFETEDNFERFIESAVRLLPYVRKIKITGGEPFLLKRHYDFLERVVRTRHARKIRLAYDSNMTQFKLGDANVLDFLKRFRAVTVAVSIDNLGPKNDYIRYGSNFDELITNVELAKAIPNIDLVVSCATGMLNAGDVAETAEFFHRRKLDAKFAMCLITKPTFLQARHLPDVLKLDYLKKIERSPHRPRFENIVRMIRQPRDEDAFQTFVRYIGDLDAHRGTSFLDLWPEFAPYVSAGQKQSRGLSS